MTLLLWLKTTNRGPVPDAKTATALWDSYPIVPQHDPPNAAGGTFPALVNDTDKVFFADFKEFADFVLISP